jgi:hypothetical protein
MGENEDEGEENVRISVELSGSYDRVVEKLSVDDSAAIVPEPFVDDVRRVLETVLRVDGGTRSRIADALPEGMSVAYDSDRVVEMLQVLQTYDLVELDGNTWRPGPRLRDRRTDDD